MRVEFFSSSVFPPSCSEWPLFFLLLFFPLSLFLSLAAPSFSLSNQTTHVCSSSSFFWNALGRQSRRGAREDEEDEDAAPEEEAAADAGDDGADTSSLPVGAAFCCF